jgi:hypothetical protein
MKNSILFIVIFALASSNVNAQTQPVPLLWRL